MLTHSPDTGGAVGDDTSGVAEAMADRVLHGELLVDPGPFGALPHAASGRVRWLARAVDGRGPHHALGRYLTDEERLLGTRFDSYV